MIARTMDEMRETNDLRHEATLRFLRMLPEEPLSLGVREWECLEVLEYQFQADPTLPYVHLTVTDRAGGSQCGRREKDGRPTEDYAIRLSRRDMERLDFYVEEIFGRPWSEEKRAYMQQAHRYRGYEQSLFDCPLFQKYEPCRSDLQDYVTRVGRWFLTLHEYAHIKCGHLNYLDAVRAAGETVDVMTHRAMELHADMVAVEDLLAVLRGWERRVGTMQIVVDRPGRPSITYFDQVVMAVIAACLSLRCFLKRDTWDTYSIPLHESNRERHPLTEVRMAVVFNQFLAGMCRHYEGQTEANLLAAQAFRTLEEFETFYFANRGEADSPWCQTLQYRPMELIYTAQGRDYYRDLFPRLLSLNELLEPYTYTHTTMSGRWEDYPVHAATEVEEM